MAGSGMAQLREDTDDPVLTVRGLTVEFAAAGGRRLQAVSDVSFDVLAGETLSLVGESGCGKSTTARSIMRLVPHTRGSVSFRGTELGGLREGALRALRPRFQMISQDPLSAVNPRRSVRQVIEEPLRLWRRDQRANWHTEAAAALDAVGLDLQAIGPQRPRQLSGGQLQRLCIARALILRPDLLVADEPVASLDVSVQAQVLNVIADMTARYRLAMLFIAHDLAVVKTVSDRVAVMYLGKLCEIGRVDDVYDRPAHPYTRALLAAVPTLTPRLPSAAGLADGDVPSPLDPPTGCRFRTRCPLATQRCAREEPVVRRMGPDHFAACHYAETVGVPPDADE